MIINAGWNVVAKGGLVLPILSLYTQQDAFTQSKNIHVRFLAHLPSLKEKNRLMHHICIGVPLFQILHPFTDFCKGLKIMQLKANITACFITLYNW
jgi:hypothetical protein